MPGSEHDTDLTCGPGPWSARTSAPPVCTNDIRRWAIATHWPEPPPAIYVDPEFARTTRWGGIVAPRDFNPFTWLGRPSPRLEIETAAFHQDRPHVMNGGHQDHYGVPIRPDDVISTTRRLLRIRNRNTALGKTRFVTTEDRWTNQLGEFVRLRANTLIRYQP